MFRAGLLVDANDLCGAGWVEGEILASVRRRRPPMIRSYSRPNWAATRSNAAFISRAFSGVLKSVKGSFLKTPWGERDSMRVGRVAVVITLTDYSESEG